MRLSKLYLDDDKDIATTFRNKNKAERQNQRPIKYLRFNRLKDNLRYSKSSFSQFLEMPEAHQKRLVQRQKPIKN